MLATGVETSALYVAESKLVYCSDLWHILCCKYPVHAAEFPWQGLEWDDL